MTKMKKVPKSLDFGTFFVIIVLMFFNVEEVDNDEDDIPTKKETEIKSSWLQKQNEHSKRKKSFSC